jgi:hypothetical protein
MEERGDMGKKRGQSASPRRSRMRWAVLAVVLLVGLLGGWWIAGGPDRWGPPPRLVLDREVVDLGDLPYGAPARAVFTLTNAGPGTLKLAGVPRVEAVKGC